MNPVPARWYVAAPWLQSAESKWRLTEFVPNQDEQLSFQVVPACYSVDRLRKNAGLRAWGGYVRHANDTWMAASRDRGPHGIISSFPQLPVVLGIRKRMARSSVPLVAWTFNLGQTYPGMRQRLSRMALRSVNRFVVHSRGEIATYSEWLDISPDRFQFLPFETPRREIEFPEDADNPFIVSMGSAKRDYRLLFAVLAELKYRTIVVAAPHAVVGLVAPPNVTIRSGLTAQECHELLQRALFTVVPIDNQTTASGQVTMLDAMMLARPVIVTSCLASVDYVTHGKDALLVRHADHDDLKQAIQRLWEDKAMRQLLGTNARQTGLSTFSEDVIGQAMGKILRDMSPSP